MAGNGLCEKFVFYVNLFKNFITKNLFQILSIGFIVYLLNVQKINVY